MVTTLYAACGDKSNLQVKHVPVNQQIQPQIGDIFQEQEEHFRHGIDSEVPFAGRAYRPDSDELLTMPVPEQAKCFVDAVEANRTAHEVLDIKSLTDQGVKALFVNSSSNGTTSVLVQRFLKGQVLRHKFALMWSVGRFNRLDAEVFSLGNSLVCIIQGGLIKFKSMHALRSIVDMGSIYMEASEEDVRQFANHPSLSVSDEDEFVQIANEPIRKLLTAIMDGGLLENLSAGDISVEDIRKVAASTQLNVDVRNGQIVLPRERRELKALLQFLDESRYTGPLSGKIYTTDNRRLV